LNSDIINNIQVFTQKLKDLMFGVEFENDIYSITMSFNPLFNCISITLKFYEDIEIYHLEYEIQIKIVPNNLAYQEVVQEYEPIKEYLNEVGENFKLFGNLLVLIVFMLLCQEFPVLWAWPGEQLFVYSSVPVEPDAAWGSPYWRTPALPFRYFPHWQTAYCCPQYR